MSETCDRIVRRRAAGEALGAAEAAHAAGCARCAADEALEAGLARALAGRARAAEPDGAFLARVTAGAAARLDGRARAGWRWPAFAGVAVACAALVVVLGGRAGLRDRPAPRAGALPAVVDASVLPVTAPARVPAAPDDDDDDDDALADRLASLSDLDAALARGARWDAILAPVEAAGRLAPSARAPLPRTPSTTRSR